MPKLTLNTIGSRYGSIDALNDNFDRIEAAVENTLSLDGTTPNEMQADLSMGDNRIINLARAINNADAVTLEQVNNLISAASSGLIASQVERQTATAAQTLVTISSFTYLPGANNLAVFVNGLRQYSGEAYNELTNSTFQFTEPLNEGDRIEIISNEATANSAVLAENVSYTPAGVGAVPGSVQSKLREFVSVKDFGAVCDWNGSTGTDDSAAVQTAVNYCIANNVDLEVPGLCLLGSSVNIDRQVDGAAFDNYFTISSSTGGGFVVNSAVAMFSSSLPYTTAPVTQLIKFKDLIFEVTDNSLTAFVLDGARYLRTVFTGCSFRKIKCLTTSVNYPQSIYFFGCQMRRWTGVFFNAEGSASYDVKVHGCLVEAGTAAFKLNQAVGCSFVQNCIEGMGGGYAIACNGSQGLTIAGNYFEANAVDVVLNTGTHQGVSLSGNFFVATQTPDGYNVFWPVNGFACVSTGNYSDGRLHSLETTTDVVIQDHAVIALTNLSTYAHKLAKITEAGRLGLGIKIPTELAHLHGASPIRLFVSDTTLDSTYGGFFTGYGVGGEGGYAAIGTSQAGTKTNAVIVNHVHDFLPSGDGTQRLGIPTNRWSTVYATTGTINTSDQREKQDIAALDAAELRVAAALKGLVKKFRFKDAIQVKDNAARIHVGVIAQEVMTAFHTEGLDPMQYGIVCYDEWSEQPELLGEDGAVIQPPRSAGNRYGVRYEELLAFIIAAL
jgi:hypothetical protein